MDLHSIAEVKECCHALPSPPFPPSVHKGSYMRSAQALHSDTDDRAKGPGSAAIYRLKSRSALPCAMRFRSASVTGIWFRKARASAIDPYG
jgi:hypothetical protein